jgi:acetyltransferase-like isoleucine patch superfamily enzyme
LRAGWGATRSAALLGWYKSLYSGLKVGRRVRLGRGVHISVVRGASLTVGDDVEIERDCQLISEGELSVGAGSFIGTGSIIVAAERVVIGRNALIAAHVTIRDQDHRLEDAQLPYNRQGLVTAPVVIGDNVWIGTKATVLRGASVGDGAVIGAHALVSDPVEPRTVVGGVPARLLKRLDHNES